MHLTAPFNKHIYMTSNAYHQAAGVQVQSFSASGRQSVADQGGSQRAAGSTHDSCAILVNLPVSHEATTVRCPVAG